MNTFLKISYQRWFMLVVITILYTVLSKWTAGIMIDQNSFRPAIALLAVYAALEGPILGFIAGFLGNTGVDLLSGDFWWNWSLGNGIIGAVGGLLYLVHGFAPNQGKIQTAHYTMFIILSAIGNYVGLILAALFDVCLSNYNFQEAVYEWAFTPGTVNILMIGLLGIPFLYFFAKYKRIN